MGLSILEILLLSALGGFILQMLPSIKQRMDWINRDQAVPNTDVGKACEGKSLNTFLDKAANFIWPVSSIGIYFYLVLYRDINTVGEHAMAIIIGAVVPLFFLAFVPVFFLIRALLTDKGAFLGLSIISVPGIVMVVFSEIEWVILSCVLVYIFLIGLWLKESAGWFGVLFTVGSIFFSLYLKSFF